MTMLTPSSSCQDLGALLAQLQRTTQESAQLETSCAAYARSREQLGCAKVALSSLVEQKQVLLRRVTFHSELFDQWREFFEKEAGLHAQMLVTTHRENATALEECVGDRRESRLPGRSWVSFRALCAPSQGEQKGDRLLVGRHRSYVLIHRLFLKSSPYLSSLLHTPLSVEQCGELRLPERYAALPAVPIHVDKRSLKRLHHYYCGAPGACRFSGLSLEELVELYAAARFACDARLERAVRERIEAKIVRAPEGHELLGGLYVASLQVDAAPLSRWVWQQMLGCLNIDNFYQLCPLLFRALSFHVTLETVQLFSQRLNEFDFFQDEDADDYIVRQLAQVIGDPSLRELLCNRFAYYTPPANSPQEEAYRKFLDELLLRAHRGESSRLEQSCLGRAYQFGDGIAVDSDRALYWYEKAAEENDPMGCLELFFFLHKTLEPSLDLEQAEAPSLFSGLPLGKACLKLLRSLKIAVEGDFAYAHHMLALCYQRYERNPKTAFGSAFREVFGEPPSLSTAIEQAYIRAAALGDCQAACRLGHRYVEAGALTCHRKALKVYTTSAWGGSKWGVCNLGWYYLNGYGLPKDHDKARLLMALFDSVASQEDLNVLSDEPQLAGFIFHADQQDQGPDDDADTAQDGGTP